MTLWYVRNDIFYIDDKYYCYCIIVCNPVIAPWVTLLEDIQRLILFHHAQIPAACYEYTCLGAWEVRASGIWFVGVGNR